MRKIVTICGSLRFFDKIQKTAELLELENGWIVFAPIPHTLDKKFHKSKVPANLYLVCGNFLFCSFSDKNISLFSLFSSLQRAPFR